MRFGFTVLDGKTRGRVYGIVIADSRESAQKKAEENFPNGKVVLTSRIRHKQNVGYKKGNRID